jgi:hypothetical protein
LQGFDTDPGTQSWIFCEPTSIPSRGRSAQAATLRQNASNAILTDSIREY